MLKHDQGFTLIELLTVVTIISILAAIAIPQFAAYREKAYTAEGYVLGGDIKKDIQEFYDHTGRFPNDNREAALPDPSGLRGKFVQTVSVRNGAFDIAFADDSSSGSRYKTLTVRPAVRKGDPTASVLWIWGDDKSPAEYEVIGENRTLEKKR